MVYGLWRALPGVPGLIVPVAPGLVPRGLTSASGGQDHTLSPSALVRIRLTRTIASTAPRLTFRDDWPQRPSE